MCDIENNIRTSWQLVSQFVSWDFCRYTYKQNVAEPNEADVLTFLRNMIVERTEKVAPDITKQEIVAKFIMETKTIKTISHMPCLERLAESVKKICPELTQPIASLLNYLENFLNQLEDNENSEKVETLEARMALAVKNFSEKACLILPVPDLFQVVQTWLQSDSQGGKRKINYPENLKLYRSVLECLKEEIKEFEIETICQELYEDQAFKKFMYKSSLQPGVDFQNVLSQSSQIPAEHSCSDSLQLSQRYKLPAFLPAMTASLANNSLSLDSPTPPFTLPDSQQLLGAVHVPLDVSKPHKLAENIDKLGSLTQAEAFMFEKPNPLPLTPRVGDEPISPSGHGYSKRTFVSTSFSPDRLSDPIIINVQPYVEDKDSDYECDFLTQRPAKLKHLGKKRKKIIGNTSDESEDTSDCDKDPEFRFLTPTMFKKGSKAPQVFYLSDQESCNSSIITNYIDSQKNDPSFRTTARPDIFPKTSPQKMKKKKKVKPKTKKIQKLSKQTTLQHFVTTSRVGVPPINDSRADFQRNSGKKKKIKKLFNPDAPIINHDPKTSSSIVRKRKPSRDIPALGNKRHCKECNITFRTPTELKKHVFIFHTEDDFSD